VRRARWLGPLLVGTGLGLFWALAVRPRDAPGTVVPFTLVGTNPYAIAVDVRARRAVVLNAGSDSVSLLNTASGRLLSTVAVGHNPSFAAVDLRTNRAFVLNYGDDTVSVLDTIGVSVLRTVHLQAGVQDVAVDETLGHVFVVTGISTGSAPGRAYMLDARTGTILHNAPLGTLPTSVAVDARTHHVFITNRIGGAVSMLDAASGRLLRTIPVGSGPMADPVSVAVDGRNGHAFVVNGADFTVSMLDTRSGAVLRTVPVGANPRTLAVDPIGARVYVVNRGNATVSVLDARSGAEVRRVRVGATRPAFQHDGVTPTDVVVDEQRGRAFVLNGSAMDRAGQLIRGSVSILDLHSGHEVGRLPVGLSPITLAFDRETGHLFVANMKGESPIKAAPDSWNWVPPWLAQWLPWHRPALPPNTGSVTVLNAVGPSRASRR